MKSVLVKLGRVQAELKAPKGQFNSFGKYRYRSNEDILEAVKPLLAKNGLALVVQDEAVVVGERYYIKAVSTVYCTESGESVSSSALAREAADKKGMDDSQITGTASSYARKYSLNALFAIDDTKDADTEEPSSESEPLATEADKKRAQENNIDIKAYAAYCKKTPETLTKADIEKAIAMKSGGGNNG